MQTTKWNKKKKKKHNSIHAFYTHTHKERRHTQSQVRAMKFEHRREKNSGVGKLTSFFHVYGSQEEQNRKTLFQFALEFHTAPYWTILPTSWGKVKEFSTVMK